MSESFSENCLSFSSCSLFHSPCFDKNILFLPLCLKASSLTQCHELCVDQSQSRGRVRLSQHASGQVQHHCYNYLFVSESHGKNIYLSLKERSAFNIVSQLCLNRLYLALLP